MASIPTLPKLSTSVPPSSSGMGTGGGPPKLINLYNLRQVATPKPCFICNKETTHCLANNDMSDWMFVCHSHVLDPAFAKPATTSCSSTPLASASSSPTGSPQPSSSRPPQVPQSEIDKVKAEYAEKQKKKQSSSNPDASTAPTASNPTSSPPTTTAGKAFSVLKSTVSTVTSLASTATSQSSAILFPPPEPVIPSPSELLRQEAKSSKVFVLNKSYFEMRQHKKKREWQVQDAKKRAKEWSFPQVPKGGLP